MQDGSTTCVELRESEMKAFSHIESAARLFFGGGGGLVWVGVDLLLLFFDLLTM